MYAETGLWRLTLAAFCILATCHPDQALENQPSPQEPIMLDAPEVAEVAAAVPAIAAAEVIEVAPSDPIVSENEETQSNTAADSSKYRYQHAVNLYRRLFQHKRAAHMEAMPKIMVLKSFDKQHKMLQAVYGKLFSVLKESKVKLTEASFVPGDPFPMDEETLHAFSSILENTALLGDLVLRLPDISHTLLDGNAEWKSLATWAVGFSNDTGILVDAHAEHLSLVAQELEIIEKRASFINPFKKETIVSQAVDIELERILREKKRQTLKKEKREQKKKLKGPRMSVQRHSEL